MEFTVSIIVPVYNVEQYLERCLDSLLRQTYKNLEIVVIDDGSKDDSLNIALRYAQIDNRIIAYHQDNVGVSATRNKGISLASGEYICFVDSDDYVEDDYIETLLNNIVNYRADISICNWRREKESPKYIQEINEWTIENTYINLFKKRTIDGTVACKLYKKSVIKDVYFDEKLSLGEDQVFFIQALEKSTLVIFQNVYSYVYCIRETSAMETLVDKRYWDLVSRAEWLAKESQNHNEKISKLFKKEEINIYITLLVLNYKCPTEDSKEIANYVQTRVKKAKIMDMFGKCRIYEFIRFFCVKYFPGFSSFLIGLKNN